MSEKQEEIKLATPIYTRNAKKRYYEKRNKTLNIWLNLQKILKNGKKTIKKNIIN